MRVDVSGSGSAQNLVRDVRIRSISRIFALSQINRSYGKARTETLGIRIFSAVSTFPKGFNTIASSRRPPSQRRLVNTCTELIQHHWPTSSAASSGGVVSATGDYR